MRSLFRGVGKRLTVLSAHLGARAPRVLGGVTTPAAPAVESGERHGEYRRRRHSCGRATTRDSVPRRRRLPASSGTTTFPFPPTTRPASRHACAWSRRIERGGVNEKAADPLGSDRGTDRASGSRPHGGCPARPIFNGLRPNTAGWINDGGGTITREPSGLYEHGGYANGIRPLGGVTRDSDRTRAPHICASGGGPQPVYTGPYTNWGGYSSMFPLGGYPTGSTSTSTTWAATHLDQRFDWSSAVNDTRAASPPRLRVQRRDGPTRLRHLRQHQRRRCGATRPPGQTPVHIAAQGGTPSSTRSAGCPAARSSSTLRLIKATSATAARGSCPIPRTSSASLSAAIGTAGSSRTRSTTSPSTTATAPAW